MVSPHKIKFNNIESVALPIDLVIEVAFDGDNGETSTYLNRDAISSETHDGRYKRVYGYKYTESFSPKFTFTKKGFTDFTIDEVRLVLKWLTSTSQTSVLDVYYTHDDAINIVDWSAIGGWTEISTYKLANNRTVGIVATFEAITPYAMSMLYGRDEDDNLIVYDITQNNKITIDIDTDDEKPVCPRITIKEKGSLVNIPSGTTYNAQSDMVENTVYFNGTTYYWKAAEETSSATKPDYNWDVVEVDGEYSGDDIIENNKIYHYYDTGRYYWIDPYYFHSSTTNPGLSTTSVRLRNTHTDFFNNRKTLEPVVVKNNNITENIVIDGANKIISSDSVNRIFGDNFNWQWLELYDGKNEIIVEGNCDITLEYREVRKVGEY